MIPPFLNFTSHVSDTVSYSLMAWPEFQHSQKKVILQFYLINYLHTCMLGT